MLSEVDLFLPLLEEDAQALKSGTHVFLLVGAKVPRVRVVQAGDLCPQLVALSLKLVLFTVGQQSSGGISNSILFIPEWDIIGLHQISTEIFIFQSMMIRAVIVSLRLIRRVHFQVQYLRRPSVMLRGTGLGLHDGGGGQEIVIFIIMPRGGILKQRILIREEFVLFDKGMVWGLRGHMGVFFF